MCGVSGEPNPVWRGIPHQREATHVTERGERKCDPKLGGILAPCQVVQGKPSDGERILFRDKDGRTLEIPAKTKVEDMVKAGVKIRFTVEDVPMKSDDPGWYTAVGKIKTK